MSRPHAAHAAAIVGAFQPAQELGADAAAQYPATLQAQTLAGDDEDDAQVARRRPVEEIADRALGRRQRHAVQVERILRHELAAAELAGYVAIETLILQRQFPRSCHPDRSTGAFPRF